MDLGNELLTGIFYPIRFAEGMSKDDFLQRLDDARIPARKASPHSSSCFLNHFLRLIQIQNHIKLHRLRLTALTMNVEGLW